jgi:hypothetical protein
MVAAVSDNCAALTANDVVIFRCPATAGERRRQQGWQHHERHRHRPGVQSVQLGRARRRLNGRVYTVTLQVKDAAGNIGTATFKVSVVVNAGGTYDDGAAALHRHRLHP